MQTTTNARHIYPPDQEITAVDYHLNRDISYRAELRRAVSRRTSSFGQWTLAVYFCGSRLLKQPVSSIDAAEATLGQIVPNSKGAWIVSGYPCKAFEKRAKVVSSHKQTTLQEVNPA
ncbi:hypothetical protein AGMMS49992_27100 [Clostridia bacterium]|nr:hypothetical protein AGMMS49992_27100 [Clostridia bacterium]